MVVTHILLETGEVPTVAIGGSLHSHLLASWAPRRPAEECERHGDTQTDREWEPVQTEWVRGTEGATGRETETQREIFENIENNRKVAEKLEGKIYSVETTGKERNNSGTDSAT